MDEQHDSIHKFIYLRQERRNIGYDRDPIWLVEDVYYCELCLIYKRVAVEKRHSRDGTSFNEFVERLV